MRAAIIVEARTWIGTPFRHQGRVKGAGVGCGTLLTEVYHNVGVMGELELPHFSIDWHLHEKQERYLEILNRFCISVDSPQPADVALFRMGRVFSHSAIVVEWPLVIHAFWRKGVEYANALQPPLARRKVIFLSPRKFHEPV